MFSLLLEWLLIIFAIKFQLRESKQEWSDYEWKKVQTRGIEVRSVHSINSSLVEVQMNAGYIHEMHA